MNALGILATDSPGSTKCCTPWRSVMGHPGEAHPACIALGMVFGALSFVMSALVEVRASLGAQCPMPSAQHSHATDWLSPPLLEGESQSPPQPPHSAPPPARLPGPRAGRTSTGSASVPRGSPPCCRCPECCPCVCCCLQVWIQQCPVAPASSALPAGVTLGVPQGPSRGAGPGAGSGLPLPSARSLLLSPEGLSLGACCWRRRPPRGCECLASTWMWAGAGGLSQEAGGRLSGGARGLSTGACSRSRTPVTVLDGGAATRLHWPEVSLLAQRVQTSMA